MKLGNLLITVLLVSLPALAQQPVVGYSAETPIGPRDVLDVKVLEDPTIGGRATVADDGKIVLNVVGKLDVSGLTQTQVEARLKAVLEEKYITKATVAVQVVQFGSQPISVIGAVMRPGTIGVSSNMTLIQAITQVGGLSQGYGKELYILRTGRNGLTEQLTVDIRDLMENGNPDLNVPLAPNDLINVPVDSPMTVFVMGEVMSPGKKQFRRSQPPTLLQLLAESGGPTDRAGRNVVIKRFVDGKEQTISVNYRDVIRGKRQDVVLNDNDTVFIAESLF